ncbi:LuxR C-terminal-related transcriptional regulator [Bifidobacterium simiiventris]|uniref:LuxR C-terminal-related transcriptional regulator n=1 Tax=Bifidobacterium simiiventris TaxID=2834434 RepID=UPI001C59E3C4|nr:response regulator transcription factor [Bifidobacterium simiiventris]MBW3078030.1 response regulator transcription factor [Bifidobacterium simiiventris]
MMTTSPQTTHSIAIVDNDVLSIHALASLLGRTGSFGILWTERNGQSALEHVRRSVAGMRPLPELILVDMSMKGLSGIDLCEALRYENGRIILLGITSYEPSAYYDEARRVGMQGVMPKEKIGRLENVMTALLEADPTFGAQFDDPHTAHLRLTSTGKPFVLLLSAREKDILSLSSQGYSSEQIAHSLGITASTVKTHIAHAVHKLGVGSKREAIALWSRKVHA